MSDSSKIDWILERRSIRKYTGKTVSQDDIMNLLKAAMYAPSAVNRQPWHFIVIDDRVLMRKFIEFHPNSTFIKDASHVILICGDEELQHDAGYWVCDCGAATENMLLAAHSLGLGACWIGIHPREERKKQTKKLFNLPEQVQPFAMVSVGYPSQSRETPDRFRPDRIHINSWGNQ